MACVLVSGSLLDESSARGQVVLDGTLGPKGSLPGPAYQITSDFGRQVGPNLFHSFSQFDLNRGEVATFTGASEVRNILARVTGGTSSSIDGMIRSTIPGANFYFMNPTGVMFGPNASVDVSGSFTVTTADCLKLENGGVFDVANPSASILTTAAVEKFGFLGSNPGGILIQGSSLRVSESKSFSLIGGDIDLDGGVLTARDGTLTLASVKSSGEMSVEANQVSSALSTFSSLGRIDIRKATAEAGSDKLRGRVVIVADLLRLDRGAINSETIGDVTGGGIELSVRTIGVYDDSRITASNFGKGDGGDIQVQANSVDMDTGVYGGIVAEVGTDATGKGGTILIQTDSLTIKNGAQISTTTLGTGDAGDITLTASSVNLDGKNASRFTGIAVQASEKTGNGGNILIRGGAISVQNSAAISAETISAGAGGGIDITASSITIGGRAKDATLGSSFARVSASTSGSGRGGGIRIATPTLKVEEFGEISALTTWLGDGGSIQIDAGQVEIGNAGEISTDSFGLGKAGAVNLRADSLLLAGEGTEGFSTISSASGSRGRGGDAGEISVDVSGELRALNGGQILTDTAGLGKAGAVTVKAGSLVIDGHISKYRTGVFSDSLNDGQGGDARIVAVDVQGALQIKNGGQIATDTFGLGKAGAVTVKARSLIVDGQGSEFRTGISSDSLAERGGDAGDVGTVVQEQLQVLNGGDVSSTTYGTGKGGKVNLRAVAILVDGNTAGDVTHPFRSAISARTYGSGIGGDIGIEAGNLTVRNSGRITADSFGPGNGGNVGIQVGGLLLDGNQFGDDSGSFTSIEAGTSRGATGNGGSVVIRADKISILDGSEIGLSAFGSGNSGSLDLTANSVVMDKQNGSFFTGILSDQFNGSYSYAPILKHAGDIRITASSLDVLNGAEISSQADFQGHAGNIRIIADKLTISGWGQSTAVRGSPGANVNAIAKRSGFGGSIFIDAGVVDISAGGSILATAQGTALGGNIEVQARSIHIDGSGTKTTEGQTLLTGIAAQTTGKIDGGKGGNIVIEADDLTLKQGGQMSASTEGSGDGGSIIVNARRIELSGSPTAISAETRGTGEIKELTLNVLLDIDHTFDADLNVTLTAPNGKSVNLVSHAGDDGANFEHLRLADDAEQSLIEGFAPFTGPFRPATPLSAFDGGPINGIWTLGISDDEIKDVGILKGWALGPGTPAFASIDVPKAIPDLSAVTSTLLIQARVAPGKGGNIHLRSDVLDVWNGARISSGSASQGDAGKIEITASQLNLDWAGRIDSASAQTGNSGTITVNATGPVSLARKSQISTRADKQNAQGITISSGVSLTLSESQITSQAAFDGGEIRLKAPALIRLFNSSITSQAGGTGGNILIDSEFVALANSQIIADAVRENAGNIFMNTTYLVESSDSLISASSEFGLNGQISILGPSVDLAGSLLALSASLLDSEARLPERCTIKLPGNFSSFLVGGRGGLPLEPGDWQPSFPPADNDKHNHN